MKTLAVSVGLFAFASLCTGAEWDAFKATYRKKGQCKVGEGYYDLPWTVQEATAQERWVKIDEDYPNNVDVYSQQGDPRLMLLFDKKENIAGMRLAFLKSEIVKKAEKGGYSFDFDYDNIQHYSKGNYFGQDLWYATVLFVTPSKLAEGGRNPLNKDIDEVAEGLFYKTGNRWVEMSRDECKTDRHFAEGNCFPGMGKHYFYRLNSQEDCSRRVPMWSLYEEGRLIGFGLAGYGSITKPFKYYESLQTGAVKLITRFGSKCMEEYIKKFGLISLHVYFKKHAKQITCPEEDWRATHC